MTDVTASSTLMDHAHRPRMDARPPLATAIVFVLLLGIGIGYGAYGLISDIRSVHEALAFGVFGLLGLALLIALGFEFV
ncbi:MAG TPA: hypothetical protein VK779_05050, partial [Rhizomicrobium sp.]|nr:hypothetical protein [Rhizomicrobium sp.]